MFNKSFISLYIVSDKLFLIQLDGVKKKIKKYASLDLPEGLIKNNKVQDKNALAQILKATWDKLHLREKSVGIIIPEFSTFTKLLTIPKLPFADLNEAVNWQSQEFLPSPLAMMTMDWKIVGKTDEEYEIQIVAMEKKSLTDYVEAAEAAGLFPLAIQIPSLCLVSQISAEKTAPRLIVYRNFSETIIVLSQADKIFGTSVMRNQNTSGIATTVAKMIQHYKDVKVEDVYVGGSQIDDAFVKELKKTVGKEINLLKPKVSGLPEKDLQGFLVPIYMQLQDLEEPSSPFSLNLLPSGLVEKYKKARLRLQIWSLTLTITLFVWISFLITLGAYLLMMQQVTFFKDLNATRTDVSQQRIKALESVKYINEVTEKVAKIKTISVAPQKVMNLINAAKPAGVNLLMYKLDLDRGRIELDGVASTRVELLRFKDNLDANKDIGNVVVPISNFESEMDQVFKISFDYLPVSTTVPKRQ